MVDFPDIPKPHLRKTFFSKNALYAPTHLFLAAEKKSGAPLPYNPKRITARPAGKGKRRALEDAEFEKERQWLINRKDVDAHTPEAVDEDECEDGDGIECGCCFSSYAFVRLSSTDILSVLFLTPSSLRQDKMVQCPDAHLFCMTCMKQYAETQLGSHDTNINCMDQSGCKLPFPVSELRRFLTPKLMDLYERVKQGKEIEMAGLEGLEECPFCEYKCVIENPDEKLFRCGNEEGCGAVTCRECKKMVSLV